MLWLMGSQRVGHDWATELNWTELKLGFFLCSYILWNTIFCNEFILWKYESTKKEIYHTMLFLKYKNVPLSFFFLYMYMCVYIYNIIWRNPCWRLRKSPKEQPLVSGSWLCLKRHFLPGFLITWHDSNSAYIFVAYYYRFLKCLFSHPTPNSVKALTPVVLYSSNFRKSQKES